MDLNLRKLIEIKETLSAMPVDKRIELVTRVCPSALVYRRDFVIIASSQDMECVVIDVMSDYMSMAKLPVSGPELMEGFKDPAVCEAVRTCIRRMRYRPRKSTSRSRER
jgi:hypothetical protein